MDSPDRDDEPKAISGSNFATTRGMLFCAATRDALASVMVSCRLSVSWVDHAYALVFSVAELLAKTLLDHAQRLSIRVFAGPERNQSQARPKLYRSKCSW